MRHETQEPEERKIPKSSHFSKKQEQQKLHHRTGCGTGGNMYDFKPFQWECEKTMSASNLRYRIRLEDHVLTDASGSPEATMFTFSYLQKKGGQDRPVLFAYNGGPGAASAWVHMGLLGPKLVDLPGYPEAAATQAWTLRENSEFLLDACDLVLIDPAGTGWTTLLTESAAEKYYSVSGDAKVFSDLICSWLRTNGRTASPVYLLGESYGTIRNLAVADALPDWVSLQGIIHIGVSFNVGAHSQTYVEPNVRRLGANAAACWYHYHRNDGTTQEKFIRDAMDFAYTDYARALLLGNRLKETERAAVLDRLAYFTGLSADLLKKNGLRFSEQEFLLGLVPGSLISMYDSRLTHRFSEQEDSGRYDVTLDPFLTGVGDVYARAMQDYICKELTAPENRDYLDQSLKISLRWDYAGYEKDTLQLPAKLMEARPELKMLFISGLYDLSSTFDFVVWYLSRYGLDPSRVQRLVLPSGHATYVGEGMAEQLNRSIRAFLCE